MLKVEAFPTRADRSMWCGVADLRTASIVRLAGQTPLRVLVAAVLAVVLAVARSLKLNAGLRPVSRPCFI